MRHDGLLRLQQSSSWSVGLVHRRRQESLTRRVRFVCATNIQERMRERRFNSASEIFR
jgi:hypothetical protein